MCSSDLAYMLDTRAWAGFAGDKASYAIGGTTIEMLLKSYSEKYGVDYKTQTSSHTGYRISKDGGATWSNDCAKMLKETDDLYVINATDKAHALWIASPAAVGNDEVMNIHYNGDIAGGTYSIEKRRFSSSCLFKCKSKIDCKGRWHIRDSIMKNSSVLTEEFLLQKFF